MRSMGNAIALIGAAFYYSVCGQQICGPTGPMETTMGIALPATSGIRPVRSSPGRSAALQDGTAPSPQSLRTSIHGDRFHRRSPT